MVGCKSQINLNLRGEETENGVGGREERGEDREECTLIRDSRFGGKR